MGATVEDAVRLLTDPAYKIGGRSGPATMMDVDKIRAELERLGADDEEADVLLGEAIARTGAFWQEYQSQALGAGRTFRVPPVRSLWVPSEALRD